MSAPTSLENLVDTLRVRGVIAADAPPSPEESVHRPWFVAMMLGLAGWFAGIFLLAFIGLTFELRSGVAIFVIGIALLASAWALYYTDRQAVFLDQLALALSIAGQCAVAWYFLGDVESGLIVSATLLVLQLIVLFVMPNKTARTLAALFATIAWVYLVRFVVRGGEFDDMFDDFGRYNRHAGSGSVLIAWLLTWVPMLFAAGWLTQRENTWMAHDLRVFARPILTGLLLGLSLGGLASEPFVKLAFGMDSVGVQMSWLALFPLLSIALAMFSAWCAFQLRSHGLLGFAVFAALMHLSRFYYLYGTSLMWKSVIMLCLGALMLGVGVVIRKRLSYGGSAA